MNKQKRYISLDNDDLKNILQDTHKNFVFISLETTGYFMENKNPYINKILIIYSLLKKRYYRAYLTYNIVTNEYNFLYDVDEDLYFVESVQKRRITSIVYE